MPTACRVGSRAEAQLTCIAQTAYVAYTLVLAAAPAERWSCSRELRSLLTPDDAWLRTGLQLGRGVRVCVAVHTW
jgi:hypothetical protein